MSLKKSSINEFRESKYYPRSRSQISFTNPCSSTRPNFNAYQVTPYSTIEKSGSIFLTQLNLESSIGGNETVRCLKTLPQIGGRNITPLNGSIERHMDKK
jgi:hypothetical protein